MSDKALLTDEQKGEIKAKVAEVAEYALGVFASALQAWIQKRLSRKTG